MSASLSYFEFPPLSDDEEVKMDLLPEGDYDFEVAKSTRKPSRAGNPMASLQLKVWDETGGTKLIFDNLIFSEVNFCRRHVKHFCYAVGLEKEYEAGKLPEDLSSYCGKLSLGIEPSQPREGGGSYPAKNKVLNYIKKSQPSTRKEVSKETATEFKDDELPF